MPIRPKYFTIQSKKGPITSVLHQAKGTDSHGAVIMVAGAGGGLTGPSAVYEELAEKLSSSGITAVRVDYRRPNALQDCIEDVMATVSTLKDSFEVDKLGIIGWSFGGAVALQSCTRSPDIIGAATVASQTYGATEPAQRLRNKRSLLLIHGTGDTCLSHSCSRQLFQLAPKNNTLKKELVLFEGDNHGCTNNHKNMHNKLYEWAHYTLLKTKDVSPFNEGLAGQETRTTAPAAEETLY